MTAPFARHGSRCGSRRGGRRDRAGKGGGKGSRLAALAIAGLLAATAPGRATAQAGAPAPSTPAAAAPAGASGDRPASPTLETILARIGGKAEQTARFVEKKYLAVLDAPVESSGTLRYQAPGRLEKNTEQPVRESMMLDGDQLVVERGGRRRSLPAAQLPGVAALVGGLRDTLAGDAQALQRMFKVVLQGDAANWQIDLLPSDTESAKLVSRITLRGREDQLLEVETLQADGDKSVMTLSPA
jgi:hypothetical protein